MYCLYSAKSTLKPRYGDWCRPATKPSTTVRAMSSKLPILERMAGSRKRVGEELVFIAVFMPLRGTTVDEKPLPFEKRGEVDLQ